MSRTVSRPYGLATAKNRAPAQDPSITDYVVREQDFAGSYSPHRYENLSQAQPMPTSLPYVATKSLRSMSPTSRANYAQATQAAQAPAMPPVKESDADSVSDASPVDPGRALSPVLASSQPPAASQAMAPLIPPPRVASKAYSQLTAKASPVLSDTLEVEIRGMQPHQSVTIRLTNGG